MRADQIVGKGAFVYFIHHVAQSIQADSVIHRVAKETLHVIERLCGVEAARNSARLMEYDYWKPSVSAS